MRSSRVPGRDEVMAVLARLQQAAADAAALAPAAIEALEFSDMGVVLDTMQIVRNHLPAVEHEAINALLAQACPAQIGRSAKKYLADRLRIEPAEAARRIAHAQVLGARRALTGEPLPARWPATAAAQRAATISDSHVREIAQFFKQLPGWVDAATLERAEETLAAHATAVRPDELAELAQCLADAINPDGIFTDEDRAAARGFTIGRPGIDGLSRFSGWATPELRATLDPVLATLAAPGRCNPADQSPVVDGEPTQDAADADRRSQAQRNHDALLALARAMLASGQLGTHRGLPVTVIVSTTLQELESAAGIAHTGGGTRLPMPDLIRMASHARHYLRIYDNHSGRELYLAESKRLANAAQRIVLHAKDRGCTRPGCTVPGYLCQAHHVEDWATGGRTDIDNLTFVCGPDHKLLDEGWTTRKRENGTTEWIPPPHLNFGKPTTNGYWHPQRYFHKGSDEDDDETKS